MNVQAAAALNLQKIRDFCIRNYPWAYKIAIYSASNHGDVYVDVHNRVCVWKILKHSSPGDWNTWIKYRKINGWNGQSSFFVDFLVWYGTRTFPILQLKFQEIWVFSSQIRKGWYSIWMNLSTRFYCIWCAAHQLIWVIEHVMSTIMKQCFGDLLVQLIGYLHRQVKSLCWNGEPRVQLAAQHAGIHWNK